MSTGHRLPASDRHQTAKNRALTKFLALSLGFSVAGMSPYGSFSAQAASQTWDGTGDGTSWQSAANWVGDTGFPGATSGFASTDDATFSLAGAAGTINLGNLINIRTLIFGVAGGDAAAFTIGDADDTLNFTTAGGITINTGVTTAQNIGVAGTTINLSTVANSTTTFTNNGSGLLTIAGNISMVPPAGNSLLTVTGSGNTTVTGAITETGAGGSALLKTGAGTLTLTNGSTWTGTGARARIPATVFDTSLVVREGTLRLNGGTHTSANETVIGGVVTDGGAGQNAKIQVDAGALNIAFLSIGRGNGIGGVSSDLEVNNTATVSATGLSMGFNGSSALNNPKTSMTLNNTGGITVTGNQISIAESAGSSAVITLNNSATFLANSTGATIFQIGQGGTGAVILNDSSSLSMTSGNSGAGMRIGAAGRGLLNINSLTATATSRNLIIGQGTNGIGAVYNKGRIAGLGNGIFMNDGATSYAYVLNDNSGVATPNATAAVISMGINNSTTTNSVFEIRSGAVSNSGNLNLVNNNGTNVNNVQFVVNGGSYTSTGTSSVRAGTGTAANNKYVTIDVTGATGAFNATQTTINLATGTGATTSTGILSVANGGTVSTTSIVADGTNSTTVINLNNGKLVANGAATSLVTSNIDRITLFSGGGTIDTNGVNKSIDTVIAAPTGSSITGITLSGTGTGYIGTPVVKITDATGTGASGVATFDPATGQVTGVTITSPGSNYSATPTITILGGGGSALTATATVGAVAGGSLTKIGTGTLTLTGANTYTGGTNIFGGTVSVVSNGNLGGGPTGTQGIAINNGATLATTGTFATSREISLGSILPGAGGAPGVSAPGAVAPDGSFPTARIDVGPGTTLTLNGRIQGDGNSRLMLLSGADGRVVGGRGLIVLDNTSNNNQFGSLYLHGTSNASNNLVVRTGAGPQFGNAPVTQDGGSTLISNQNGTFSAQFSIGTGGAVRESDNGFTVFRTGPIVNVADGTNQGGLTFQDDETSADNKAGTLGLGGINTFTGNVIVNGNSNPGTLATNLGANGNAILSISQDANLGNAANDLFLNGATLQVGDGINTVGTTNTAVNANNVIMETGRTVTLTGTATFNIINDYNPQLNVSAAGTTGDNATLLAALPPGTNQLTIQGQITGAGILNKNGAGTLVLTNVANDYTGGTTVFGGMLSASANEVLGNPTRGIAINNGAEFNATSSFFTNRNISLGTALPGVQGVFNVSPGASALGTAIQPNGEAVSAIISAAGGATLDLRGQILGDANSRLMLARNGGTGNGTILLNNTNGAANASSYGALYLHGTQTSDVIANGAAMDNLIVKTAATSQTGNAQIIQDGAARFISNQTNAFSAGFKIGNGGAVRESDENFTVFRTGTISNVTDVTNAGGLTFQDDETSGTSAAGTLGLSGTNTFGGNIGDTRQFAVTVNGNSTPGAGNATLSISADANLGKFGNSLVLNGATLAIENALNLSSGSTAVKATFATARTITITGTSTIDVSNTYNAALYSAANTTDPQRGQLDALGTSTNTFTVSGAGTIQGAGNLNKVGAGTLALGSATTFTGSTTINGGTLEAGAGQALGSTSSVIINTGGTLLLSNAGTTNRINNAASMILNGGTFNTGGLSEMDSAGIDSLTLSATSTLDFASGASILWYGMGTYSAGTLSILNWSGNPTPDNGLTGGGGTDQLRFTTALSQTFLDNITFDGYGPGAAQITFAGADPYFEVVPLQAIPEPTTVFGALALVGLIGYRERRRFAALLAKGR